MYPNGYFGLGYWGDGYFGPAVVGGGGGGGGSDRHDSTWGAVTSYALRSLLLLLLT